MRDRRGPRRRPRIAAGGPAAARGQRPRGNEREAPSGVARPRLPGRRRLVGWAPLRRSWPDLPTTRSGAGRLRPPPTSAARRSDSPGGPIGSRCRARIDPMDSDRRVHGNAEFRVARGAPRLRWFAPQNIGQSRLVLSFRGIRQTDAGILHAREIERMGRGVARGPRFERYSGKRPKRGPCFTGFGANQWVR